jgi:hypothetical protein
VPSGKPLWRACNNDYVADPWWFDDGVGGRFNPVQTGKGACYFAMAQLGGLLESIGPEMADGAVHVSELTRRSVVSLGGVHLHQFALADLVHINAVGYQVTNALSDTADYVICQEWAVRFLGEKLDGVHYRTRFDTGPAAGGIAVFGTKGPNPYAWPAPARTVPATTLRRALERKCRLKVLDTPPLASLPNAPPPP